jgi:hypothetical protein
MAAMWTPEFSFVSKPVVKVKQARTDFTFNLRSFLAVVEIKKF